ncbi:MAG: NusG domain II-containing protein [Elusimicrobiota bacterium]
MTKRDILLSAVLLVAAGVIYLININTVNKSPDNFVINLRGESIYNGELGKDQTVKVIGGGIYWLLKIEDNSIRATESGCPKKICIKQGPAYNSGQTLVCVPQKLTLTVKERKSRIDAISR